MPPTAKPPQPQPTETTRLGRSALAFTVFEDGRERARPTIDGESTVPLVTEILDGNGQLYRLAVLVDFTPGLQPMPAAMPDMHEMAKLSASPSAGDLPAEAAGYRMADVYGSGDGSVHCRQAWPGSTRRNSSMPASTSEPAPRSAAVNRKRTWLVAARGSVTEVGTQASGVPSPTCSSRVQFEPPSLLISTISGSSPGLAPRSLVNQRW